MTREQLEEYESAIAAARKALDFRKAQNDDLHARTPAAIEHSYTVNERRLTDAIDRAVERGDAASLQQADDKRKERDLLVVTKEKQEGFEEARYAAEKASIERESRALDDLASRHAIERANLDDKARAERAELDAEFERRKSAEAPPVLDPNADAVTRLLDNESLSLAAEVAIQGVDIVAGDPSSPPELPSDVENAVTEATKQTYVHSKIWLQAHAVDDAAIDKMVRDSIEHEEKHPSHESRMWKELDDFETEQRWLKEQEETVDVHDQPPSYRAGGVEPGIEATNAIVSVPGERLSALRPVVGLAANAVSVFRTDGEIDSMARASEEQYRQQPGHDVPEDVVRDDVTKELHRQQEREAAELHERQMAELDRYLSRDGIDR